MERSGYGIGAQEEKTKYVGEGLHQEHTAARHFCGRFSRTERLNQIDFSILSAPEVESCAFGPYGGYFAGALNQIPGEIAHHEFVELQQVGLRIFRCYFEGVERR